MCVCTQLFRAWSSSSGIAHTQSLGDLVAKLEDSALCKQKERVGRAPAVIRQCSRNMGMDEPSSR